MTLKPLIIQVIKMTLTSRKILAEAKGQGVVSFHSVITDSVVLSLSWHCHRAGRLWGAGAAGPQPAATVAMREVQNTGDNTHLQLEGDDQDCSTWTYD